jgi:hypothetical protein
MSAASERPCFAHRRRVMSPSSQLRVAKSYSRRVADERLNCEKLTIL